MKLFSLGVVDTDTTISVSVSCPVIKGIESSKVKDWTRLVRKKRDKAWLKKHRMQYNNCKRLMQLAEDCDARIDRYYNLPCRKGNEIQFIFEFSNKFAKGEFVRGLDELDKELS